MGLTDALAVLDLFSNRLALFALRHVSRTSEPNLAEAMKVPVPRVLSEHVRVAMGAKLGS